MVKEGDKAQIDWIFPDGGLTCLYHYCKEKKINSCKHLVLKWYWCLVYVGKRFCFVHCRLVQENPEVAMDSIVHITQQMTAAKRAQVFKILAAMDSGSNVENSNGDSAS